MLTNLLDLAGLALLGFLVAIATGAEMEPLERLLPGADFSGQVTLLMLGTVGLFVLKTGLGILFLRISLLYLAKVEGEISTQIARLIFNRNSEEIRSTSKEDIEWSILRSSHKAVTGLIGSASTLLVELSLALFVVAFLAFTDWALTLGVVGYFALLLTTLFFLSRRSLRVLGEDFAEGSVAVSGFTSDLLATHKELLVSSKTNFFVEKLAVERHRVARSQASHDFLGGMPRAIAELGLIVGAFILVFYQTLQGQGSEGLASLGLFLVASLRIVSSFLPMLRSFQVLRYDGPLSKSAQEILLTAARTDGPPDTELSRKRAESDEEMVPLQKRGAAIFVEALDFRYNGAAIQTPTLSGLSLRIERGSFVTIVGPSGSGKSTFADLITGTLEPSAGQILVNGLVPRDFIRESSRRIAYVPQRTTLVAGTIQENIALGEDSEMVNRTALLDAVDKAGLRDVIAAFPQGLRGRVGTHNDALSGGQIQRIGLARALYRRPDLLVLDEPTSALDPATEETIASSLSRMKGETTIVVVSHRLSTIKSADTIFVIDSGRLAATGSFAELTESGLLSAYSENLLP